MRQERQAPTETASHT